MSTNEIIKWSSYNDSFPYKYIEWESKVNKLSYTWDYFNGDEIPAETEDVPAEAWFWNAYYVKKNDRVYEFNIPFKNYNSILTVLYFD
ncbi:hypothetical protein BMS3Abin04_02918 [bacterium BMS3Abin04]|nr:hypothetical protein BMS3Abin04_02918 [bacterium BMS3Abin04]